MNETSRNSTPGRQSAGGSRATRLLESSAVDERAGAILGIVPGERPLLPEFGWRAHLMPRIETPVERAVAGVLAESALDRWAPDLGVERVDIAEVDAGRIRLTLRCRERSHDLAVMLRARDGAPREHTRRSRHEPQA